MSSSGSCTIAGPECSGNEAAGGLGVEDECLGGSEGVGVVRRGGASAVVAEGNTDEAEEEGRSPASWRAPEVLDSEGSR